MFNGKKILACAACLVINFCYANVYKKDLIFLNCTAMNIQMDTISSPYKFSLSPTKNARNGYSEPYSLTIPSQSVLKYKHMSVYFNSHIDGSINFNFSGGVNGHAILKQKREKFSVSGVAMCPAGGVGISWTEVGIDKIVGFTDDSSDIEFLNNEQIIRVGKYDSLTKDTIVINLGCHSIKE